MKHTTDRGFEARREHKSWGKVCWAALVLVLLLAEWGWGLTRVRNIARPLGERTNKLVGMGIVTGLQGTGDGGDSLSTIKALQVYLQKLGNPSSVEDLSNARNVALVQVTAELGRNGFRNGDEIDVQVTSLLGAKSLAGGVLSVTDLRSTNYQDNRTYAIAQGAITIPDENIPTMGIVKNGATVEEEFANDYVRYDPLTKRTSFTLVLDDDQANFQMAKTVAQTINEESAIPGLETGGFAYEGVNREPVAWVLDPRNIEVTIPLKRARNPAMYIAWVMNLLVELPDPEATIVINEKAGTIAITGNVEIAPSIVHVNGLMIRIVEPKPEPTFDRPVFEDSEWGKFDTTNGNMTKVDALIEALDQLNVPVRDKIKALYALRRAGSLRARIIEE